MNERALFCIFLDLKEEFFFSFINFSNPKWPYTSPTFVTIDEPTSTKHHHPKSTVCLSVHSCWFGFVSTAPQRELLYTFFFSYYLLSCSITSDWM
uniref:Uncharacterized protein n=1 Tax=Sus scrofa TaxID=9823 RepID=A0A8D0UL36_PIG